MSMLARELDNLDAIQDSIDADAAAKAEAADRARESRAREAAAKRRERAERLRRIREDEARETAREVKATRDALFTHTGPYANTSDTFSRSGISPAEARRLRDALQPPDTITRDEVWTVLRGFLTDFKQLQSQFAANFSGGTGLNNFVLEQLTREQTNVLRGIAAPRPRARPVDDAAFAA